MARCTAEGPLAYEQQEAHLVRCLAHLRRSHSRPWPKETDFRFPGNSWGCLQRRDPDGLTSRRILGRCRPYQDWPCARRNRLWHRTDGNTLTWAGCCLFRMGRCDVSSFLRYGPIPARNGTTDLPPRGANACRRARACGSGESDRCSGEWLRRQDSNLRPGG